MLPSKNQTSFDTVDTSRIGVGCVIFQMNDEGKLDNISYNSRLLTIKKQKLSTKYRDLIGLVHSI